MSREIHSLVERIRTLEEELRGVLYHQKTRTLYKIHGRRVSFEPAVKASHKLKSIGFVRWLLSSAPEHLVAAPFVYGMLLPMAFYDAALSVFQAVCFRLFKIPRVERSKYIAVDRHQLGYLNSVERFNCVYCGYANGLLAYAREITARTEQYWCPIKHAHKLLGTHQRYARFLDYGDAADYPQRLEQFRERLRNDPTRSAP